MRIFKAVSLLLGGVILVLIIRKLGVSALVSGFQRLGWKLVVPVLVILPCYLLYTVSWQLFLNRFEHFKMRFWLLFRIKVAGEAANTMTPLNFAGGDPVRIWLLSRYFPVDVSSASVVVDRTLQILAIVTIILLGNLVALLKMQLPLYARYLLGGTAVFTFFFVIGFIVLQTKGFFRFISGVIKRVKWLRIHESKLEPLRNIDQYLGDFYHRAPALFFTCYLLHFSARFIGIFEFLVLAHFLNVPMGFSEALFFSAVVPVVNLLGAIVPGNLGILEGIVSSLFASLNWDPTAGFVIQVARRVRSFVWIVIGVLFILAFKRSRPTTS